MRKMYLYVVCFQLFTHMSLNIISKNHYTLVVNILLLRHRTELTFIVLKI